MPLTGPTLRNWRLFAAVVYIATALFLVGWWVWPTPWSYYFETVRGGRVQFRRLRFEPHTVEFRRGADWIVKHPGYEP